MQFYLNESQQDLLERAKRLLDEAFSTEQLRRDEASSDGFPRALWDTAVAHQWPAVVVPEAHGGNAHGLLDACVMLEEIGRSGASLPLVTSAGVSAALVAHAPSGDESKRLLDAILAGAIVSPAFVDEDGRNEWDTDRLAMHQDGDGHRLNGTKVLVPFGAVATEFLVTVASAELGPATVVVGAQTSGVTVTPHHARIGVPLAAVTFDDVSVSAAHVLHHGEAATVAKHAALQLGTLLTTAEAIGSCEALIALTADYVTTREAFGRPIGTFQAVSHPCADMRVSADAIRMLVQQAAWMVDDGQCADEQIPAAKGLANEHFERVANDAYRLHGARGFSNECDVQIFMRRLHGFFGSFGETQESFERAAQALGMS